MNIEKTLLLFGDHLRIMKGYSNNTLTAYLTDLKQFSSFLDKIGVKDFRNAGTRIIRQYLAYLSSNNLQSSSISRKLTAIKMFYKFAFENNMTSDNRIVYIKDIKYHKKLPEIFSETDYTKALLAIKNDSKLSDYCIALYICAFELLYGCSLRVSELCNLKWINVNRIGKTVKICGKGEKERIVPIGKDSLEIVDNFIKLRDINSKAPELLLDKDGQKLYPVAVYRIVKKYLGKVTELKKKSPHILRHSSATHMLDNGANLLAIKEILGHESLSTTQLYTQVSIVKLKEVYKKSHPKS